MSDAFIHPTAIVDSPDTHIGNGTRIWHFSHIMPGAWIGERCSIGHGCYIGNVRIGDGCRVQNHVSIFDGVTLEDDVFLGPSCAFTNVKHPRAHVMRRDAYEPTRVCKGASIGANATVMCGVTIGAYAVVGAGAVVTRDVMPHEVVVGTPGRRIGWACRCGETLGAVNSSASGEAIVLACKRCGDRYVERAGSVYDETRADA